MQSDLRSNLVRSQHTNRCLLGLALLAILLGVERVDPCLGHGHALTLAESAVDTLVFNLIDILRS